MRESLLTGCGSSACGYICVPAVISFFPGHACHRAIESQVRRFERVFIRVTVSPRRYASTA